jgi:hypothetical protein
MRRVLIPAVAAVAALAGAGMAHDADASVRVTATPRAVNPGAGVAITARVAPPARAKRRAYRCRALMSGPFGERLRLGSRSARSGAPMRWRTRIPQATYGFWQAEVVCPGAGFGVARVVARLVSRPPQITGVQWRHVAAAEVWTWAARITNPSRAYDLQGVRVTASFRDASGRVVATDATPDLILPRSSAAGSGARSTSATRPRRGRRSA